MGRLPLFYMYDIARGAYLRPEAFKRVLEHAAGNGFTHFVPYLENMIRLPSSAKAAASCAYTPDDWRVFQETAQRVKMELVPHFNVIGHADGICRAYPELTGRGKNESPDNQKCGDFMLQSDPSFFAEMDPTLPVSRDWMCRCLDEYCSFSRSEYFLIGGDEWNAPAHLLARADFDPGAAWCGLINDAVAFLHARGRTPIIWHDMLVHYPHTLDTLSRDAVVAFWFYDDDAGYPFLKTLKDNGFRVIMATGLCNGALSLRRERAFHRAVTEAERYRCDGFMVTTWMDGRFERQMANISLSGELLRGKRIESVYPRTATTFLYYDKLRKISRRKAEEARKKLFEQLKDPLWCDFPDYRDLLAGTAAEDFERLRRVHCIHHYPEGALFNSLAPETEAVPTEETGALPEVPEKFGIEHVQDPVTGNTLHFYNDGESFTVYPDYGARLQNWRTGKFILIADGLLGYLKKNPGRRPGGFRSYNSPGFMPMWNIGTHLNPNILWQVPWDFELDTNHPEQSALVLHRKLPHVEVVCRISITRGMGGFRCRLRARNHLPGAYGSFGWNCCFSGKDILETVFQPDSGRIISFFDEPEELLRLQPCSVLSLKNPRWSLKITSPLEKCAGFSVDWGVGWMTPDLHGRYVPLEPGMVYETAWSFALERTF